MSLNSGMTKKGFFKGFRKHLPPILGTPPLGVTGVVAAEVPVEALRPLPAKRCTHNIPLTGSSVVDGRLLLVN